MRSIVVVSTRFILSVGYKHNAIREYFGAKYWKSWDPTKPFDFGAKTMILFEFAQFENALTIDRSATFSPVFSVANTGCGLGKPVRMLLGRHSRRWDHPPRLDWNIE